MRRAGEAKRTKSICNCTTLRKASRRVSQLYDAVLAPSGIKTTQRAILAQVDRTKPISMNRLADALVMDSGGLKHTLKPLERDGLIVTSIDPSDRRSKLVDLTPVGQAKLVETEALWAQAQAGFELALGGDKASALRDTLEVLFSDEFPAEFAAGLMTTAAKRRGARR
jgi:DNA-binding MarR family transcriptional regulator